jgi:hypothetical protein
LKLPNDVLTALGNAAGEILVEERAKLDPLGQRIFDAYFNARDAQKSLSANSDRQFFDAREMKFKYVS